MAGGHPTEMLEATFDIVHEESTQLHLIEAETLFVGFQAIKGILARDKRGENYGMTWYIRLGNTRLADSIIDLCGVPVNERLRKVCYDLLSKHGAPAPFEPTAQVTAIDCSLYQVCEEEEIPVQAIGPISSFLKSSCPFPPDIREALVSLQQAILLLRTDALQTEHRRVKRFEDAARQLRSMQHLVETMLTLDMIGEKDTQCHAIGIQPMRILLDLGLRQRRKHYHGGTIFQFIVLPERPVSDADASKMRHQSGISRRGIKVAEGGNYSALVRQYRPPGNFAASVSNYYTTARIPQCAGIRLSVGKLVELVYLKSTLRHSASNPSVESSHSIDQLRECLGHPFSFAQSVQVLVVSTQGMDHESTPERFLVASKLWNEGISAEYLPHSGIALSLARRLVDDDNKQDLVSDWSLMELQGACSLLQIPFLVIVQPHLLRDKGSVRLRQVSQDFIPASSSSGGSSESFVQVKALASTIRGLMDGSGPDNLDISDDIRVLDSFREPARSSRGEVVVDCTLVDVDQYYSHTREVAKNDPRLKSVRKTMKIATLQVEAYLSSMLEGGKAHEANIGVPVFAVTDVSFFMLRDFGTELMRREGHDQSAVGACTAMIEKYPHHRRTWKTLAAAIDNYMKQRNSFWSHKIPMSGGKPTDVSLQSLPAQSSNNKRTTSGSGNDFPSGSLITMFLYSKVDDRFDTISLNSCEQPDATAGTKGQHHHRGQTSVRKR
jgi:hypothetical protein